MKDCEQELRTVSLELGYFPSRSDLEMRGLGSLSNRVQKTGGFVFWSKRLSISPKNPRKIWTENMLIEELVPVCEGIGHMPSNHFLKSIGKNDLAIQISRRGGFSFWSEKVGFERLHSDSDTGWDGEKALLAIFEEKGFKCERSAALKAPHDLLVNDLIRIDVKAANYAEYGACKGWFYRIGKDAQADIIALYELDTKDVYFIPWNICPKTNITISVGGGKYKNFKNRFDLIESLAEKRKSELDMWNILD